MPREEIGGTKGQTHEKVLEQTIGRERALRNLSMNAPSTPQERD